MCQAILIFVTIFVLVQSQNIKRECEICVATKQEFCLTLSLKTTCNTTDSKIIICAKKKLHCLDVLQSYKSQFKIHMQNTETTMKINPENSTFSISTQPPTIFTSRTVKTSSLSEFSTTSKIILERETHVPTTFTSTRSTPAGHSTTETIDNIPLTTIQNTNNRDFLLSPIFSPLTTQNNSNSATENILYSADEGILNSTTVSVSKLQNISPVLQKKVIRNLCRLSNLYLRMNSTTNGDLATFLVQNPMLKYNNKCIQILKDYRNSRKKHT